MGPIPARRRVINLYGTGIDWFSGDVFQAALSYDGKGLSVTITDTATGASATQVYSVDIPGTVGGSMAYVGFTAGTDDPGLSPTFAARPGHPGVELHVLGRCDRQPGRRQRDHG